MKRIALLLLLFSLAVPAWASRKITIGQLEDLLRSLQQAKKSDNEVATELKQIELTEELTRGAMNSLVNFVPGPLSTEQIYVLEASSADLVPPASDLPAGAAPDAAAQQAMLAKSKAYITKTYLQLPRLTATKTTLRFQDNMEVVAPSSGVAGGAKDAAISSGLSKAAEFLHFINSAQAAVEFEHGAEKAPAQKDKALWGANRMIALKEPDPSLGIVFPQAVASGTIRWLRWELVNGGQVAVFSFAVSQKTAGLPLDICCFPNVIQTGVARFYTAATATVVAGNEAKGGVDGVTGNMQSNTTWHDFKTIAPYHGEFFIDPETGIVVRMITEAELKPSDVVHQVDTRIDYGLVKVGAKGLVAPVRTILNTQVVPNGDSGARIYSTRRTLFIAEYKDYK